MHLTSMKATQATDEAQEARAIAAQTAEDHRSPSIADLETLHGPVPIDVALPDTIGRAGQTYRRQLIVDTISAEIVRLRIQINWTDNGAAPGSAGGRFDHTLQIELLRDRTEVL